MKDHRDIICRGNGTDIVSTSNGACDRGLLVTVGDTLQILSEWMFLYRPDHEALTFPAKYAAPPWDIWRMIGAFLSRAASSAATAVEEDVTFWS